MLALIVDDSRAMRSILTRLMGGLGFNVSTSGNDAEALSTLDAASQPDVILVDWNMSVLDGLALVKEIRSREQLRHTPLMMVVTEYELKQIDLALAAGANEYIVKPFTDEGVAHKLSHLGLIIS